MLFYHLIMSILAPGLLWLLWLRQGGPWTQRLGMVAPPVMGDGPRLWLHGASNGELASVRWVLTAVLHAVPTAQVLVSCNTATARAMVQAWAMPGVSAVFAPLDAWGAAARVLQRWQPRALVIVENELWPERIKAAQRYGVPVLVIGARLSARSARRWQLVRGLIGQTLARVDWLSAQDTASQQRFIALGLAPGAVGPMLALKSVGSAEAVTLPFAPPAPRHNTLLAASTHAGEDSAILDAFVAARPNFGHLIIAPRHPRRAADIAALIGARGLSFAWRSKGQIPGPQTLVHLADTMGEMENWYAMSGVCIIGGTFADKGGHTPWEPERHSCTIVHGRSVANFAKPFAALDAAGGAICLDDIGALEQTLATMTPQDQTRIATAARRSLPTDPNAAAVVAKILQKLQT